MSDIVQKLWGFCHTLRHDGIDYGDYIEQITYLLFLKMTDERAIDLSALPFEEEDESGRRRTRKKDCSWPALRVRSGVDLTDAYAETLRILGKQPGILGDIYAGAQSRFTNPVNLKKLVSLIDETEWTSLGVDVKAEAYEGLLERAASEGKKGAGQYFTPRVLIQSIVRCMKPDPRVRNDFSISDPACGTGGFLVAAYEWLMQATGGGRIDRNVAKRIKRKAYHGQELVPRPRGAGGAHETPPRRSLTVRIEGGLPHRPAGRRALAHSPLQPPSLRVFARCDGASVHVREDAINRVPSP